MFRHCDLPQSGFVGTLSPTGDRSEGETCDQPLPVPTGPIRHILLGLITATVWHAADRARRNRAVAPHFCALKVPTCGFRNEFPQSVRSHGGKSATGTTSNASNSRSRSGSAGFNR